MDSVLYGSNDTERIVAVHQQTDSTMRIYLRRTDDTVVSEDAGFYPFFHLTDAELLAGYRGRHWVKELAGANAYRFLCAFPRWSEMWEAVRHVLDRHHARTGRKTESWSELPEIHLRTDAVSQYLLQSGRTLFKGMAFPELRRMQLDIETYTSHGHRFSNAARAEDRITFVALADSRGFERVLGGPRVGERELLNEVVRVVRERDPDVIEGHNIFNFDLPYLLKRCEFHGIDFAIGRDGSSFRSFESRASFADRAVDYTGAEIGGRHVIDTWLLLQSWDVSKRSLESYSLKAAAKHFGFASPDRLYLAPEKLSWYFDHEPDLLARYALDDVRETGRLSEVLSPPYFYLAQMVPMNYGTVARAGSAAKIESLLLREYIRQKHSVPAPGGGGQGEGGYTEIFLTGIAEPVVDADIESLYPSIMIAERIAPRSEALGVFTGLLAGLTTMRLEAKRSMKQASDASERAKLDALQSGLKILINSFYGYLGYQRALFNDMAQADAVTARGREILHRLIDAIRARHATVVQVDTDGILFSPPPGVTGPEAEATFVSMVARELPDGIRLAMNGRAKAMLSYKKKNYALLGYDERITVKGSSLSSRSLEKFGRNFLAQCIEALLERNVGALHRLYVNLWTDIAEHRLTVHDFARTETLHESAAEYLAAVEGGGRNRTASYEVALAAGLRWRPGDRVAFYITGKDPQVREFEHCRLAEEWDPAAPDENAAFYQRRLHELAKKFELFFEPQDFRAIFSVDDLFPFSEAGIAIVTRRWEEETPRLPEGESGGEPRIWLEDAESDEEPS